MKKPLNLHTVDFQKGFTLLETLVAMAILAIAMVAVIQTAGSSVTAQNHLQDKVFAEWVVLNQLTRMQVASQLSSGLTSGLASGLTSELPGVGKYEGTEKMAGRQWRWLAEVEATSNPYLLKAVVHAGHVDQQQYLITLTGYIGLPNE